MNDPGNPLGWSVWRQGARLGAIWAVVFFVTTGVLYAALGPLGWRTTARALCAMGAGPVIASALIAAWWLTRRPVISDALETPPAPDREAEDDV